MINALMVFHGILSILLILVVLVQFGKGAEAGLISGGAGDEVMSSASQGNILSKITIVIAVLFFANSILLARLQSNKTSTSILDNEVAVPLNKDAVPAAAPEATKAPEAPKANSTK